jgi:electron transfer flavoprotein alpha subunit
MAKVLVVAETKDGQVRKPTLELLSQARKLSLPADAVLIGKGVKGQADALSGHGAATVYIADDGSLVNFSLGAYLAAVKEAAGKAQATQIWFSVSELSKALAPALSAKLDASYVGDVAGIEGSGDTIIVTRPAMATKVVQKVKFAKADGLKVISIRSGAFDVAPTQPKAATIADLAVPPADTRVVLKEVKQESGGEIDLGDATRIVSVGRGVKSPEGVEFVKPLASALGAGFGASRAVVDSGWMPYHTQIGQTGRVVTPDVYFAIGVSGAIQHLAGMSGSKLVVAVNKDPEAPIFSVADYGIVADLFKAVPVLIEEIKKQHRPYGMIFTDISGGFTNTSAFAPQEFKVNPVMAYRFYPDGRKELVRGIDISGTPLVALQSIRAASREIETFNGVCGAESGWVPVSASAPSLLLEKLEVERGFIPTNRETVLAPSGEDLRTP